MKRARDAVHRMKRPRPRARRAVVLIPSGLTLANLFFGIFAIVMASRGDFATAGLYVVLGGILDAFDGRVARATNTGTSLGSELDSLVDVISFGLAPAMIMYFAVLSRTGWDWIWSFAFVACAALRLARFNVEQAGRAKRYFHGLPSPAAGLTLATYYWFSQTPLYNDTNIANLPWHAMLRFLMLGLGALMVSDVSYPAMPTIGVRTVREWLGTAAVIITLIAVYFIPRQFFFPACMVYVLYGLGKTVILGLLGRRAELDVPVRRIEEEDDEPIFSTAPIIAVSSPPRMSVSADTPLPELSSTTRRRRRRRPRGDRSERSERSERMDRPERTERAERPDRGDRPQRPRRSERGDRSERPDRTNTGGSDTPPSPPAIQPGE